MATTVIDFDTACTAFQEAVSLRDCDTAEWALLQIEMYGVQTRPDAMSDATSIKYRLEVIASARQALTRLRSIGDSAMVVRSCEAVPE